MKNNNYGILIKTLMVGDNVTNEVSIVNIDEEKRLEQYYEYIGCRIVDIVYVPTKKSKLVCDVDIVVDDEGLLVDNPVLNPLASMLSKRNLFGNVILMKYDYKLEDNRGFTVDELHCLWKHLCENAKFLRDVLKINVVIAKNEVEKIALELGKGEV